MIFHIILCTLVFLYILIRRKTYFVSPLGYIAIVAYFVRFFIGSYWISSGLFSFAYYDGFNEDLYNYYIYVMLVSLILHEIVVKWPISYRIEYKRRYAGSTELIFVVLLFNLWIYYWYKSGVPIVNVITGASGLEEARSTVINSNSGLTFVLLKHVIHGFVTPFAAVLVLGEKRSTLSVIGVLGILNVLFIGRKSGIVVMIVLLVMIKAIADNVKPKVRSAILMSSIMLGVLVLFYTFYGYSIDRDLFSRIGLRIFFQESASSYLQYQFFIEEAPSLRFLNMPFIQYFVDDIIDIRTYTYDRVYGTSKDIIGNMQGFSFLFMYLVFGRFSYVIFPLIILVFFVVSKHLSRALKMNSIGAGIILFYLFIELSLSILGVNIFSFFSTTIIDLRLLMPFLILCSLYKLKISKL